MRTYVEEDGIQIYWKENVRESAKMRKSQRKAGIQI